MNMKRMPRSFRWISLAFGLGLAGKLLAAYPGHILLQWLGAVALVWGSVLMVLERRFAHAGADVGERSANSRWSAAGPVLCAVVMAPLFLLLHNAEVGAFAMGLTLGIYLMVSIRSLLASKGQLRRC